MFELIPFGRNLRSVSGFDPFRGFDDMERNFFGNNQAISAFRTDVSDTGDAYKLEAELPGFNKDDIKIDLDKDCLTISAERSSDTKDEKSSYVKRERFYGSYSRSFDMTGINTENIDASYNDGVLTLTLPKKASEIPASRRLEIK